MEFQVKFDHDMISIQLFTSGSLLSFQAYNKWREWCGLSVGRDFNSLPDISSIAMKHKLGSLYE